MPNHISTNFRVSGPTNELRRFMSDAASSSSVLSLNNLLPMPDELRVVSFPVRIMTQAEIDKQWADWRKNKEDKRDTGPMGLHSFNSDRPFALGITKETSDDYKAKYGTDNWYDWSVSNWGSKWDIYDVTEWNVTTIITPRDCSISCADIFYMTAWSPVTNAWQQISKKYPTLEFFHEFADEGGGFVGSQIIQNGDIVEDNDYEWNSDAGIVIRENVGMSVEEDEG